MKAAASRRQSGRFWIFAAGTAALIVLAAQVIRRRRPAGRAAGATPREGPEALSDEEKRLLLLELGEQL